MQRFKARDLDRKITCYCSSELKAYYIALIIVMADGVARGDIRSETTATPNLATERSENL